MRVTVAIPCRDRLDSLFWCLASIINSIDVARSRGLDRALEIEVNVVNDNSGPGFEGSIRAAYPTVNVVNMGESEQGPGAARNTIFRVRDSDAYLFTDSDCIVDESWCAEAIRWLKQRPRLIAQGVPWLYQCKQNPALGLQEQQLYQHMFSHYIDRNTCTMLDPRSLLITAEAVERMDGKVFASWITDASAEDRVMVQKILDVAGVLSWEPRLRAYHEDPSHETSIWRQKFRHGSGRVYIWKGTPSVNYLLTRYFDSPLRNGLEPRYVITSHLAFLFGYRTALSKQTGCADFAWWGDVTAQLEERTDNASAWIAEVTTELERETVIVHSEPPTGGSTDAIECKPGVQPTRRI